MKSGLKRLIISILLSGLLLTGCATTDTLVARPTVSLTSVELESVSFGQQTFLLGFQIYNPNAFPLPVRSVRYRVLFDDQRFAGGDARGSFMVPANETGEFQLSSLGELWHGVHPESLRVVQTSVEGHVLVMLWDDLLAPLLPYKAVLVFALPGLFLASLPRLIELVNRTVEPDLT